MQGTWGGGSLQEHPRPHPLPGEQGTVPVRAHPREGSFLVAEHQGGNGWFLWFIALLLILMIFFFFSPLMLGLKSKS